MNWKNFERGRVGEMNWKNFERGTICVIRLFNGKPEALRLVEQHDYKAWVGCFSILGVK
jgi:hypothetical protein